MTKPVFDHKSAIGKLNDPSSSDKTSRDEGFPFYAPHAMTGVDQLHNQGLIGEGVQVAIIDTGVDFTHPALGGCFGPGCKVAGGADLVGDAFNGSNTPNPGSLPQCIASHE
jgi:subtilisin family serine protease